LQIGLFDSGVGGLTILSSIIKRLPKYNIYYVADNKYAPYGEKDREFIKERSFKIASYLIKNFDIKILVVACNSATSAAIEDLRKEFSSISIVGVEPGIKPAIEVTKSKNIAIMATPATLNGTKYKKLSKKILKDKDINLIEQPCPNLAKLIEDGKASSKETKELLKKWLTPMKEKKVDTIVLGCTHYPLISKEIENFFDYPIQLIETGDAIAKRVLEISKQKGLKAPSHNSINIFSTAFLSNQIIKNILKINIPAKVISI